MSPVEQGRSQAGAGCAGSSIAMADELNRLGILEEPWDVVVYDVLGDVVCGGSQCPCENICRPGIPDHLCRFMALYAANNIMRGVARYSNRSPVGRAIQNRSHGAGGCLGTLLRRQSGTRVVGILPEDRQLRRADTAYHRTPSGTGRGGGQRAFWNWPSGSGIPSPPAPATGDEALEAFCRRAAEQEVEGLA